MYASAKPARTAQARIWRVVGFLVSAAFLEGVLAAVLLAWIVLGLTGCQTQPVKPIVQTIAVPKPVPVPCKIPPIERPAWETERANPADPVLVSRAIRAELEQRRGYEIQVEAAVKSCQ